MKITSEPITEQIKREYPYHGKGRDFLVLFFAVNTGIVVKDFTTNNLDFEFRATWEEECFTPITYKTTFEG